MSSIKFNAHHEKIEDKPNILFCIADDWGWPHAGAYGDQVVQTPTFDRLAREGVLFEHAFVSSPSCTPSRNAILTGQHFWRLAEGANLWSTLNSTIPTYQLLLKEASYHVGYWRKSWGPGNLEAGGYTNSHPAGTVFTDGFEEFLKQKKDGVPFSFWLGASDPHRPYEPGIGAASDIDPNDVQVPGFYPDEKVIRSDIADYYYEVQRFDSDVGKAIKLLEEIGELENTIIVMTGDHGMPFPRCKGNLYDMGVHVPLVIRWGDKVKGSRKVKDFVSLTDLAVTFLDFAGADVPEQMTGQSLKPILLSDREGWIEENRDHVVFGRERHVPAQLAPSLNGYPSRGIRTDQYLYIKNLEPQRWPAGVPDGSTHPMDSFPDCDNGPTKTFLITHQNDLNYGKFYDMSFAKRPEEELYDVQKDPAQINNLAELPKYKMIKKDLSEKMITQLKTTNDPRFNGASVQFDKYPYRAPYPLNSGKR